MPIWKIKDEKELSFRVENPQKYEDIYFPLTNTQGKIFSWISSFLSGDIKTSFHNYLTYPATVFDIKNPFCLRTLWLYFKKNDLLNISCLFPTEDKITLEAGPLWFKLIRKNKPHKLLIEAVNFVPEKFPIEIMWIKLTNESSSAKKFIPVTSIPLFCRCPKNIIDHRHVTSLLNRALITKQGIIVKPTLHFDERGHKENKASYFVLGYTDKKNPLSGVFSNLSEFCGEKGSLIFPESVYLNKKPKKGNYILGKENIAGLKFKKQTLKPKESINIFLIMGITLKNDVEKIFNNFNAPKKVLNALKENKQAWFQVIKSVNIETGNKLFDFWIKWVNLQPTLRKLFGCSFLAHFDYGKGGRGFRDLWQDLLSRIMIEPKKIKNTLINNFKGTRIDGSNATIITKEGKFISDRNKISRVWSDHGVWPYLTLKAYIDRTADYNILFKKVEFFKDHQLKRAKEIDLKSPQDKKEDYTLKDKAGRIYKSTVLDHILIQNLVQFFNVGPKGNTKLENADWNDALDMAVDLGETVPFSSMYAHNLKSIADLLEKLKKEKKIEKIEVTFELKILLDSLYSKIDYSNLKERRKLLEEYLEKTKYFVEGKTLKIKVERLIEDLKGKSNWTIQHIREKEWLKNLGFFNGYYDNNSQKVEGKIKKRIRIMLPSQTFPLMSGIATKKQTKKILKAISKYLKDEKFWAFKLNTNFRKLKLDLGRAFGFSYGDKENGSIFSHMNVMLAYSLYKQGFVKEGYKIIDSLFKLATNSEAKTLPCIPEYFNLKHKGLYPYLTGSASWLIYLLTTQVFGIKFDLGKLIIEPKLTKEQFLKKERINIRVEFEEKILNIVYFNPQKKSWPNYSIKRLKINNRQIKISNKTKKIELSPSQIKRLLNLSSNILEITIN